MSISKKIKSLRQLRNMEQKEIADKLGLSQQMISFFESDNPKYHKDPSLEQIYKLADLFGVSPEYLINRDDNQEFVPDNILLLKGNLSWDEFENDIVKRLGNPLWKIAFSSKNLKKMSTGDLEPDDIYINSLAIYAEVDESFFYKHNNNTDLLKARDVKKQNSSTNNPNTIIINYEMSDDIRLFISQKDNLPYIELAKKMKDKNINLSDIKI